MITVLKKISFIILLSVFFCLVSGFVFAENSNALDPLAYDNQQPLYHSMSSVNTDSATYTPAAQSYYIHLKKKVDKVLQKKIKQKLYKEVFNEDLLNDLFDEDSVSQTQEQ